MLMLNCFLLANHTTQLAKLQALSYWGIAKRAEYLGKKQYLLYLLLWILVLTNY